MNPEADRVLDALRKCTAIAEIDAVAKGANIDKIKSGPDGSTRLIHVRNLAALMRRQIRSKFR